QFLCIWRRINEKRGLAFHAAWWRYVPRASRGGFNLPKRQKLCYWRSSASNQTQTMFAMHEDTTCLPPRQEWRDARRIVVKIGSALLTNQQTGRLKVDWLASLVQDIAELKGQGRE